jgi:hypothetical protein
MKPEHFKDWIEMDFVPEIQRVIKKGVIINGEYFRYKSLNAKGTKWQTSDHGILNCDVQELLLGYAFDHPEFALDIDPDYFIQNHMEGV